MKKFCFLLFLWPMLVLAQKDFNVFPKDTSFTVQSTARKIAKDFPQARAVSEFRISSIEEKRDRVYWSFGKRKLHIDVFYPKNIKRTVPGVLLIHGGGWASGSKSHLVPLAQKLAEAGFVAATAEYRLSPEALYPAGVIDLKTALKWLKVNGAAFGLDTSQIAVLGTSAGATLAALLGTTGDTEIYQSHQWPEISDKVQAIVNIDGVVDFTDPAESGKDNDPEKPSAGARWFGATFHQKPELWMEASPLTHLNRNTPPTLFINSSLPRFHAGRDQYLQALNQNNTFSEVHTIRQTPHPFWLFYPWFDEVVLYVNDFLHQVFGLE
jgi:pectinesterase